MMMNSTLKVSLKKRTVYIVISNLLGKDMTFKVHRTKMNCLSKDEQTNNSEIVDMVSIAADGPAHIQLMIPSKITSAMRVQDVQEFFLGRSNCYSPTTKEK